MKFVKKNIFALDEKIGSVNLVWLQQIKNE